MDTFQILICLMFTSYYLFCLCYICILTFDGDDEYTVKRRIFLLIVCFIFCIILTPIALADALANKFKIN